MPVVSLPACLPLRPDTTRTGLAVDGCSAPFDRVSQRGPLLALLGFGDSGKKNGNTLYSWYDVFIEGKEVPR